jgi:hypothetical protein
MSNLNYRFTYGLRRMGIAAAASVLVSLPGVLLAEDAKLPPRLVGDKPVTAATLLDRIQIEDFLTKYYYDLSAGKAHELSEYFTKDAYLDVDSTIARGHAEIAKLYQRPAGSTPAAATAQRRRGHMLLTNPVINIDGDKATAEVIWTGVMNEGVGKAPSLYEEGREYSELRKIDGKWLISKRCISSDSGLPDKYDATYKPRERC